jgi:tRNA (guanine-N7-)-methyltransferase
MRIQHGDALEVLGRVPDGALSFLYLLHPDPWPKARHAKRRMMKWPARTLRTQAQAGRRIPLRDRPSDLPAPCADGHAPPYRHLPLAGRNPQDFQKRPAAGPKRAMRPRPAQGHEVWYFRYRRLG